MKTHPTTCRTILFFLLGSVLFGQGSSLRKPTLDRDGRFWLYGPGLQGEMPFSPYAWMPANAGDFLTMDFSAKPRAEPGRSGAAGTCIAVQINWQQPYWCAVAFLSGPDSPSPWWGEDTRGWHFDLSGLPKKKLVVHARGETGGEKIQIKFGILGDKKYGDSLPFPAVSDWLTLSKDSKPYELDLARHKPADLVRICNGFTFAVERRLQAGNPAVTRFYIDSIYFE